MTPALANIALFVAIIAAAIIRAPFARARRHVANKVSFRDAQETILLTVVTIGMVGLPLLYVTSHWLAFANYTFQPVLACSGIILTPVFLWLFWRSHADLGTNWSVTLELRAGQTLITRGVYQRMRHPMYAAFWLWALTQLLLIHNWIVGPAGLITFGLMYFLRVPREEAMMLAQFGDEYRSYMARTRRITPFRF